MDDELWFEEEIVPPQSRVDGLIQGIKSLTPEALAELTGNPALAGLTKGQQADYARRIAGEGLRGTVRAHRPVARPAVPGDGPLGDAAGYARGTPILVKLGAEFDLDEQLKANAYRYKKLWCRAFISAAGDCRPRVLDVYPDRLYEGEARQVKVEVKPSLKLAAAEFSLGGLSTDVQVGVVAPVTTGWLGDEQRAPYWETSERQKELLGRFNFWFLLDLPEGCDPASVRLSMLGEGDFRFHMFAIPAGPRQRERARHQTVTLQAVLVE